MHFHDNAPYGGVLLGTQLQTARLQFCVDDSPILLLRFQQLDTAITYVLVFKRLVLKSIISAICCLATMLS